MTLSAEHLRRRLEALLGTPATEGNSVAVYRNGDEIFPAMLDAIGVGVWNFQPSMLHAKIMTVDGTLSVIGSSNFNRRSMDHDEEIALAIFDPEVTATLDDHYDDDLSPSRPIDLERWRSRSTGQRVLERAVQPERRWL